MSKKKPVSQERLYEIAKNIAVSYMKKGKGLQDAIAIGEGVAKKIEEKRTLAR